MANDIRDEHREAFERVFAECQDEIVRRMMDARLPNAYLESFAARMAVYRAAACDQPLALVLMRIGSIAGTYDKEHALHLKLVREYARDLKARRGNN